MQAFYTPQGSELPVNAPQGNLWNEILHMLFVSFQPRLHSLFELNGGGMGEGVQEANTELCTPMDDK